MMLMEAPPKVGAPYKVWLLHQHMPAGYPSCFASRDTWMGYLEHVVAQTRELHADGPLRFDAKGVRRNSTFSYCDDCRDEYRRQMLVAGRCDPTFLHREPDAL